VANSKGELLISSADGQWRVLDERGKPVVIDREGGSVAISGDGSVRQGDEIAGRLAVYAPSQLSALRKSGGGLFDAGNTKMTPMRPALRTGAIEQSNFDVMSGLTSMIEASRAYEINANILRLQDESVGQVVNTVGRLA
jgi:flagellar basal-body rod protein FlgF